MHRLNWLGNQIQGAIVNLMRGAYRGLRTSYVQGLPRSDEKK